MAEQATQHKPQGQTQPQGKPAVATPAPAAKPAEAPAAKATKPREAEMVKMKDGRTVEFVGKRKLLKETLIDEGKIAVSGDTAMLSKGAVTVRLDFRNGETRTYHPALGLLAKHVGHGGEQKLGDETAGVEDVEDMVVAVDDLIKQLGEGNWSVAREGGGFAGASVVIRAIMEAAGKSQDDVKAFLQKKLDSVAGLTRAQLYASFRKPGTKTGIIIERLEKEKLSKESKIDADAALSELK